jgi:hypothetical protein
MKKYLLFIIGVIYFQCMLAQSWSLGANGNYGLFFSRVKAGENFDLIQNNLNENLNSRDGYDYHLKLSKQINSNWQIDFGVGIAVQREVATDLFELGIDHYKRSYNYGCLPLSFNYFFNSKFKFQPFIAASFEGMFLIGSKETVRFTGDNRNQLFDNTSDLSAFVMNYRIGFGFRKRIDKHTNFIIGFNHKANLNSFTDTAMNKRWMGFQLGLGITHSLVAK